MNYKGEKHNLRQFLVPAITGGDIYGIEMLKMAVSKKDWDVIFLFNDMPIINLYLKSIHNLVNKDKTKIVVYFPVDSMFPRAEWFRYYDIVDVVITYTKFGKQEVERVLQGKDIHILYHGVDRSKFKVVEKSKALSRVFGEEVSKSLVDSVIFLNANRNQPRKRFDLTIGGFYHFVRELGLGPEEVRLYLHAGLTDAGYDLIRLIKYYGIDEYVLLTKAVSHHPYTDLETFNYILNIGDVGVNTSTGEGFGLLPLEHGALGKPQVIPDNSVHKELFGSNVYYIDCPVNDWSIQYTTLFRSATPRSVGEAMKKVFLDIKIRNSPKIPVIDKRFDWDIIAGKFVNLLGG